MYSLHYSSNAFAFCCRWSGSMNVSRSPMHCLPTYRDQLGNPNLIFIWEPYMPETISQLPGRRIWRSVTYLICYNLVEPHMPHRVCRQFGLQQNIPNRRRLYENVKAFWDMHEKDRRGKGNTLWHTIWYKYVQEWERRYGDVHNGQPIENDYSPSTEYMNWYLPRTVRYISNPAPPASAVPEEGFQDLSARQEFVVSKFFYLV